MFQNLLGLLRRTKDVAQVGMSLIPSYLANLLWLIETSFRGLAQKGYGQNAAVYACLRILSESVPEPPMLVHTEAEDGTLERAPVSHAAQQIIRNPNELQTEFAFWELVTLYLGIVGRAVIWKERDNVGRIIGRWPLRPDRVGPIYSTLSDEGSKVVKGFSYQVPGTSEYIPIPRSEVELYLVPDPAGESGGLVEGLGPMQVLAREIAADNEATTLVGALLANYAQPSLLIKTTVPIPNKEQARLIKESFRMELGGAHRGEPALLDGAASIEKLSFDLHQLEFPNLRDVSESRISAAFGVPAILVGLKVGIQASIKATIEEQRELFTEGTLASYWRRIQDTVDRDLLPEFGPSLKSVFDTTKVKALQHQSKEDQDKVAEGYQGGAVTLDEYRTRVLGLPELGGVVGTLRFIAVNGTFVDENGLAILTPMPAPPQAEGDAAAADDSQDDDQDDQQRTAKAIANALVVAMKAGPPLPKGQRRRLLRLAAQSEQAEISLGDALQPRLVATLTAQRDALVAALPGAQIKAAYDAEKALAAPGFLQALKEMDQVLAEGHLAAVQLGYQATSHELGQIVPPALDLTNPHVAAAIQQGGTLIKGINGTTIKKVRAILREGAKNGATFEEMAQLLHDSVGFTPGRAKTIARTETGMAYGRGAAAAMRDLDTTHVAITDGDDWDAPCIEINGTVQTIEWYEANLKEHPNCTRAAAPVPDTDTPKNDHGPLHLGYARFHWLEGPYKAQTITAASLGKDLDKWADLNGVAHLDAKEKAQAKRDAESLQHAAQVQLSTHAVLYRGLAVKDLATFNNRYKPGQSVTLRGLAEATTDLQTAGLQAIAQKGYGLVEPLEETLTPSEAVPVVLEFHNAHGIIGYDLTEDRTVLQNGATYRVKSIVKTADGAYHVELWAQEKPHQPIIKVKPAKAPKVTAAPAAAPAPEPTAEPELEPAPEPAAPIAPTVPTPTTAPSLAHAVGDLVHVKPKVFGEPMTGTVVQVNPTSGAPYHVALSDGSGTVVLAEHQISAHAPTMPAFDVGDQVEITSPGSMYEGLEATVVENVDGQYLLQLPSSAQVMFDEDQLVLVPSPSPTPTLPPTPVTTSATAPAAAAAPPTGQIGKWVQADTSTVALPTWEYQHATLGAAIIVQNPDGTFSWSINGALTKQGTTDTLDKAKATSGAYFSKAKHGAIATNPGPKPSAQHPTAPAGPAAAPQTAPTPAPAQPTAPTAAAPPPPQNAPQAIASSTLPFDPAQLVVNTAEGQGLGGVHPKTVYTAPDGSLWMFKPQDHLTSAVDVATWQVADLAGFDAAKSETYELSLNGQTGSIQRMHGTQATRRAAFGKFGAAFDPTKIDANDALQLQKHAVFDWLISNHDTHAQQYVRVAGDRTVYAIDKGQAFKFFGKDKLDPSYDPNNNAAISKPSVYTTLWKAYANGDGVPIKSLKKGGNAPLRDFIGQLQSINDASYRDALRPYALEAAKGAGHWHGKADAFLDAAVARKASLLSDFEALYAKLDADRDAALAPKRAAIPAGLQGMDGALEFASDAEGQRYGKATWPKFDAAGFTADEKDAIRSYKGSGYHKINGLPGGSTGLRNSPTVTTEIATLDKALRKHPFGEDTIVLRGTSVTDAMPNGPASYLGKLWRDPAFLSSSLGVTPAFSGTLILRIRVPAGTPTYYLDHTGINASEREVLLPRGAEYFVHSATLHGSTWNVEMEMVPNSYPG